MFTLHHVLVTKFNDIYAHENVKEKVEVYNLKNSECQAKFKEFTSNTTMLSTVFDANENINVLDVVLTVSSVLGYGVLSEDQKLAADINMDGVVNIVDVTLIIDMLFAN
mgnify:CR=1 FL=1